MQNGEASVHDISVLENPDGVRQQIGVVFQNPSLDKKLTVKENLIHQGRLYGLKKPALIDRIKSLVEKLKLESYLNEFVENLSGGYQRRVEICKGLLHDPKVLLLDEPSTGLDPGARRDMWDLLLDLKAKGMTMVVTTHLMEEGDKCDRIAILNQGKICASGTPDSLKARIGGDIISLQTKNPQQLARDVKEKFGLASVAVNGHIRIEKSDGHKFIPQVIEAFPGLIEAATVGKPNLEDVFIRETGRRFD